MRLQTLLGCIFACVLPLESACSQDVGECWAPSQDGQGGAVSGPSIPQGAGGLGESPPPEPQDTTNPAPGCDDAAPVAELHCAVPGSTACVEQCEAIGAYCVHLAKHPYSPSSGTGELYWCKGGSPTWTCSYQYANGDNCTRIYPFTTWLCRYTGGK